MGRFLDLVIGVEDSIALFSGFVLVRSSLTNLVDGYASDVIFILSKIFTTIVVPGRPIVALPLAVTAADEGGDTEVFVRAAANECTDTQSAFSEGVSGGPAGAASGNHTNGRRATYCTPCDALRTPKVKHNLLTSTSRLGFIV